MPASRRPRVPAPRPTDDTGRRRPATKGGDGNRSDPPGYADYQTERALTGSGEARPVQRSRVVPKK